MCRMVEKFPGYVLSIPTLWSCLRLRRLYIYIYIVYTVLQRSFQKLFNNTNFVKRSLNWHKNSHRTWCCFLSGAAEVEHLLQLNGLQEPARIHPMALKFYPRYVQYLGGMIVVLTENTRKTIMEQCDIYRWNASWPSNLAAWCIAEWSSNECW